MVVITLLMILMEIDEAVGVQSASLDVQQQQRATRWMLVATSYD